MSSFKNFGNYFTIYINDCLLANTQASMIRTPYGTLVDFPLVSLEGTKLPWNTATLQDLVPSEVNGKVIKAYDMHIGMRGRTHFSPGVETYSVTLGKGEGGFTHYPPGTYSATFLDDDSAFACISPHQPIFYNREASLVPANTAVTMPGLSEKFLFVGDGTVIINDKEIHGPAMLKVETPNIIINTVTECAILKIWI
jgi:hypothetical protein